VQMLSCSQGRNSFPRNATLSARTEVYVRMGSAFAIKCSWVRVARNEVSFSDTSEFKWVAVHHFVHFHAGIGGSRHRHPESEEEP
jgi:hypothetical protein